MERLRYFNTNIEVKLGDCIEFKKVFKKVRGEVVYVPGKSPINKAFGDDAWAIQLDDEPGDVRSMIYVPSQEPFAPKKIKFLRRSIGEKQVSADEKIL